MSQRQNKILKGEIKRMLHLNIIEMGQSDYASPMILVESTGKDPRQCIDYRLLNANVRTQFFPLHNIEERVERVAAANYITVIDLAKGYWQIPLRERARRYSAFVTSFGTYIPLRMPFGLVNAPYFFSKLMAQVFQHCDTFAVPYSDEIAIYSENWEDHIKNVAEVLKRIGNAQLTIKASKSPLTQSLKGTIRKECVNWTQDCNLAFTELKNRLTEIPVVHAPDYNREFIVQADVSDLGTGVVLSQRNDKGEEHPVLFLSKKFTDAQRRYGTTEKECAAIIYAIKKLRYYLDGQQLTIETDHNPLV
ncbi:Transposon Ty3-I Gag-Pol polyprotein [Araneus ventricosus]|uniref:Transposon Ty3-I Gag-Pol polyprotein n=1 Tax=Araneus ventricosus TaxID=182803 RepID=A0A4Y2K1F1_ARAVE|nr:Transposon Ty3-I Gag-Pol polyprotein [Araneus ventricosus]